MNQGPNVWGQLQAWWQAMQSHQPGQAPVQYPFVNQAMRGLAGMESWAGNKLGVGDILQYASRRPAELGYTNDYLGSGDSMRHLLLAAELQRTHPWLARPLLWGHENVTNLLQGQGQLERQQDLYNNQLGLQIGRTAASRPEIESAAIKTQQAGLPTVLSPEKDYGK